jgi:hypothetical protein
VLPNRAVSVPGRSREEMPDGSIDCAGPRKSAGGARVGPMWWSSLSRPGVDSTRLRAGSPALRGTPVGTALVSSVSWTPAPIGEQCPRKRVNSTCNSGTPPVPALRGFGTSGGYSESSNASLTSR